MTNSGLDRTLYLVSVSQQGALVATHSVEAPDALSAINLVEHYYGEPVKLERVSIEDEADSRHEVTVANNWHGFMFSVRKSRPAASDIGLGPGSGCDGARSGHSIRAHADRLRILSEMLHSIIDPDFEDGASE